MAFIHIWAWKRNPDGSDGRAANEEALEALKSILTCLLPEQPIEGMLGGGDTGEDAGGVDIYVDYDFDFFPLTRIEADIITRELEKEYRSRFPHLEVKAYLR